MYKIEINIQQYISNKNENLYNPPTHFVAFQNDDIYVNLVRQRRDYADNPMSWNDSI